MRPCRALRVRAVRAYLCAPPPPQTSAAAAHGHATSSAAAHRNDGRVSAARRRATALVQAAQQRSSRRRQQQQQHRHVTATRATGDDAAAVATAALDAAASLGRSACLLAHAHTRPSCNNNNNNDDDDDDDDDASAEALLRRVDDAWQGGGGEAKLQWVCATPRGRTALRTLHAATTTMTTTTAAAASSHDATLVDYVAHMQPTSSTLWRPPSGTSSLSSPLPRDNNDDDIDGGDVDATTAAVTRRLDDARERQERRCWKQQVWSMLGADAALAYSVDVKDLQQCNNNNNSNNSNTATATHTRSSDVTSDAAFARLCRDLGVGVSARRAYVMRRLLPYLDAHDDSATPSLAHVRARARALCDEYDARTRQHTDNNDDNDNHEVATTALDDERDALRDKLAAFQARLPALQRLVESMSK